MCLIMKKSIAVLLIISVVFLLCSCSIMNSEEDKALLAAVQQDLINSRFKTKFDTPGSKIDTTYVVTFTEDTITYDVTSGDNNNRRYSYSVSATYTLTMKKGEPFIKVDTNRFEDLNVILIGGDDFPEDGKVVKQLKGDKDTVGHYYSRVN